MRTAASNQKNAPVQPIGFSENEKHVLTLIAGGKTGEEIADSLYLTPAAIEAIRLQMISRVKAKNIFGVITYTIQTGIIDPSHICEPFML